MTPEQSKTYYAENKERIKKRSNARYHANKEVNKERTRSYKVRNRYGITLEEYDSILSGGCCVCGTQENLCCDHDHKTGKVRGCLCKKCNSALGLLNDDIQIVQNLLRYLEVHNV